MPQLVIQSNHHVAASYVYVRTYTYVANKRDFFLNFKREQGAKSNETSN